MTRDEIVQLAWDIGLFMRSHQHQDEPTKLERFAALVAAHEREACAKVCKDRSVALKKSDDEISTVEFIEASEARRCAAAIRERDEL